ncbi:MAG TPA: bifunctional phosphoribosyl-AMP cyclohydrolase/phosphoribosyl-ATP diphosphatase HisIE [Steroidobacteraceae bacterium]|nr:bifunctional phosphoribosyl-AMP cyclohydrolase/phosphoribosyl-ATP diphosphatase HisIE [Steroidobacteraceae bacterium]
MNFTPADIERIDWNKTDGLVPAIVQHAGSGRVLMLGYMNRAALAATLARGRVVFFSRSKQRLWEKGESSGNILQLIDVRSDCDADTLLVIALPAGAVCHTGSASCFGAEPLTAAAPLSFLLELEQLIAQRIAEAPEGSYTARLYARGVRRVAQKVGEEGLEVALAGAGESDAALLGECADLLYHLLVLLRSRSLPLAAVIEELRRRHETDGDA